MHMRKINLIPFITYRQELGTHTKSEVNKKGKTWACKTHVTINKPAQHKQAFFEFRGMYACTSLTSFFVCIFFLIFL